MGAVGFVLCAEGPAQLRLFIEEHKDVRSQPRSDGVEEQVGTSKQKSLTEDECGDCDVHGISNIAVEAVDDERARGKDRRRCANAFKGEACEGFEDYGDAGDDKENADHAKGREAEERRRKMPMGDPPGDETCDGAGGEDEEYC